MDELEYTRVNWKPEKTALSAKNLNNMDLGIANCVAVINSIISGEIVIPSEPITDIDLISSTESYSDCTLKVLFKYLIDNDLTGKHKYKVLYRGYTSNSEEVLYIQYTKISGGIKSFILNTDDDFSSPNDAIIYRKYTTGTITSIDSFTMTLAQFFQTGFPTFYIRPIKPNPILSGGESTLNSLQIGTTNYALGNGTKLYKHILTFDNPYTASSSGGALKIAVLELINTNPNVITDYKDIENMGHTTKSSLNISSGYSNGEFITVVGVIPDGFGQSNSHRLVLTCLSPSGGYSVYYSSNSLGSFTDIVTEL